PPPTQASDRWPDGPDAGVDRARPPAAASPPARAGGVAPPDAFDPTSAREIREAFERRVRSAQRAGPVAAPPGPTDAPARRSPPDPELAADPPQDPRELAPR